jgi:hypothetical protein
VVHYFDTWLNDNEDALLAFFDRGGKLQIVTPNPADGNLVAAVQARFLGTTKVALESKIRGTLEKAASIHKRSRRNDAVLDGYTLPFLPLYCAIQFDGRELMLSPYEHLREVAVKSPRSCTTWCTFRRCGTGSTRSLRTSFRRRRRSSSRAGGRPTPCVRRLLDQQMWWVGGHNGIITEIGQTVGTAANDPQGWSAG